ncbi:MAG TPA: PCYCGC motif-containing (lipo)protein [Anaerolineae bacterium]
MSGKVLPFLLLLSLLLSPLVTSCGGHVADSEIAAIDDPRVPKMAPLEHMPHEVQNAPQAVREAYQFAVASPEIVQQLPCYCGCVAFGHRSNYDCYVAEVDPDGTITYDMHAIGCTICVDITQDAMAQMRRGKSLPEIQSYVEARYAPYGPSTMP